MKEKWTNDEIILLKDNYINMDISELSILLDRTEYSIIGKMKRLGLILHKYKQRNVVIKSNLDDYDWVNIQKYYDCDGTWRGVMDEYNIHSNIITMAKKRGLFKTRNRSESIILSCKLNPKTLSEETKKKISISRIKYLKENPDKVPYLLNHYSKGESYPETYFDKIFMKSGLKYDKFLQISIYQLDFAFTVNGINVEIDGDQHHLDKRIVESNKRKDIFLKEKGWDIIRIRWSHYKKLSKDERTNYIDELISYIKGYKTKLVMNNE